MDQVLSSNPQIDFTSLLMATTDQNLVAEAEEKIRQYEGDNIKYFLQYLFLKGLANEIQDEQKPPTSRQVAGLLLYRSLTSTDSVQKARKIERWLSFPEEFRLQIKNMSLKGLASKVREICSSSAQVVSAIAVIEIPRGQWTELINKLLGQIQDQTSEVKESILRCLGFICQDIPDIKCIQDYSDAILTAVVSGMNQNQGEAVMLAATNALNNSLFFAQKNFEKENERNYIMEVVCQMISVGNHEIRLKALECIINISEYYYKYLQPYMERIFGLTIRLMADSIDEEEVKMAIEFWATICDIEISFRYNKFQPDKINLQLTRQASHHIVPVIIRILEQKDEEFQQEDFSRILAAADLLSKITQEVDKQIIDDIIKYMNENISSQDWHKRDAAIHSFGLILNEQSINKTQTQTLQLLPVIMKMLLSDQSEIVKNTASWTICQITKFHKVIVIQNVENVVNNLLQAFQSPSIYVQRKICRSINYICQHAEGTNNAAQNFLTPLFLKIYDILLSILIHPNTYDCILHSNALEALETLIINSSDSLIPDLLTKLDQFIQFLPQSPQIQNEQQLSSEYENIQQLQSSLLQLISISISRIGIRVNEKALQIFQKLYQLIQSNNVQVHEDILLCLQRIALIMNDQILNLITPFLKYITDALQFFDSPDIINNSLILIQDLSRIAQKRFGSNLNHFVTTIIQLIKTPSFPQICFHTAFETLAEIALAVGEMFQPYLVETMNLSVLAAQQKSNQDGLQIKDPEDFIQNLQEAILMLWTYIIQGLINDNKIQLFQQYVEFVMSFVTLSVGNATSDLQLSSQYNPHQNTQFIFGVNVPIQEGYKIDRDVFKEKKMTVRFACLLIDLLQALIDAYSSDLFPLVNTAQLLYFIDQCSNSNGDGYTILKKKGRQLKKSLMKIASLLNERR